MSISTTGARSTSDFIGIGLSLLCLIHCLALPMLIAFAPALLGVLPGGDATHRGLAVVIGMVGFFAFRSGYKVHRKRWLLGLFSLGMLLILIAAILGAGALTVYGENAMTVCGGLLLVTAHICNHSFCGSCRVDDCSPICSADSGENVITAESTTDSGSSRSEPISVS